MKEPEAETHWLDEHRDPTEAAVVRSLAAQVVAQHGGDLSRMRRALGMSNATWVGGGLAVRIANTPLVDDMAAEVALGAVLGCCGSASNVSRVPGRGSARVCT